MYTKSTAFLIVSVKQDGKDGDAAAVIAYGQHDNLALLPSPSSSRPRQALLLPVRLQYAIKLPVRALEQLQLLQQQQQAQSSKGKQGGGSGDVNYGQVIDRTARF